jgi:ATP-binding cassette subfamily B protein
MNDAPSSAVALLRTETSPLEALSWPTAEAGAALRALVSGSGLPFEPADLPPVPKTGMEEGRAWITAAAEMLGLEIEEVIVQNHELGDFIRGAPPALFKPADVMCCMALGETRGRRVRLFLPGDRAAWVHVRRLEQLLIESQGGAIDNLMALLESTPEAVRRTTRLRHEVGTRLCGDAHAGTAWLLRVPSSAHFARQLRNAGLVRRLGHVVALGVLQTVATLLGWVVLASGTGRMGVDRGRIILWMLVMVTAIPLQAAADWLSGTLALRGASLLKRRMFEGSLRASIDEARMEGIGSALAKVNESLALESAGGAELVRGLGAVIQLSAAALLLSRGPSPAWHLLLLTVVVVAMSSLAVRSWRARCRLTERRMRTNDEFVERIAGHRTCLAQQPRDDWHLGEDDLLAAYLQARVDDDRCASMLPTAPGAWLLFATALILPRLVAHRAEVSDLLGLAGVILAMHALMGISGTLLSVIGLHAAWRSVESTFRAAYSPRPERMTLNEAPATPSGTPFLHMYDAAFRYADDRPWALSPSNLVVRAGDRLLVEGASGGGKSTLASLLVGLRQPQRGIVVLDGQDHHGVTPDAWRRRIVMVPQFHENHLYTNSMAFNLLLARGWPPRPDDLEEAERICDELGLGPLLQAMPAGIQQLVGENGWQLSHGERSRVFIARAILQNAEALVLDESLGSLDPETLELTMRCVARRARTLVVIAHL